MRGFWQKICRVTEAHEGLEERSKKKSDKHMTLIYGIMETHVMVVTRNIREEIY